MTVEFIKKATAEELTTDEVKKRDLSQVKMILHQSVDLEQFLRTTYKKEQEESEKPKQIVIEKEDQNTHDAELETEKETFLQKVKQVNKKIESSKKCVKIDYGVMAGARELKNRVTIRNTTTVLFEVEVTRSSFISIYFYYEYTEIF